MSRRTPPGRLSPRQAAYLTELARGGSMADAAARLGRPEATIRNSLVRARRHMGATTTLHLLALAITVGDIDPDCADGTAVTAC